MNIKNGYNKDSLEALAIAAIEEHGLVFFTEVCAYLPCSTATAYNYELEKLESIKEAIAGQRIMRKVAMRKNWFQSTQPTLQMGLYKLLATPEELAALSMQQIDHTTKGERLPTTIIQFIGTDDEDTDTPEVQPPLVPKD